MQRYVPHRPFRNRQPRWVFEGLAALVVLACVIALSPV